MSDINFGAMTEALNDKADRDLNNMTANIDYVVESKYPTTDDPTWYRKYKSGWLEQGGRIAPTTNASLTYSFPKPFLDSDYTLTVGVISGDNYTKSVQLNSISPTSFSYKIATDGGNLVANTFMWSAAGQGA